MKVMCVNDKWNPSASAAGRPKPEVGDIDTVIDEIEHLGYRFYELERFPDSLFMAINFATLPDQTADEMKEAEHEAIVNLETA